MGADAPFAACFDERVTAYDEPALTDGPIVRSRTELEAWIERERRSHPGLSVTVTAVTARGPGAVCEAIVETAEPAFDVWRIALAARLSGDLICEVRAFWARGAAERWLAALG